MATVHGDTYQDGDDRLGRVQALVRAMRESMKDEDRGTVRQELENLYDDDGLPA